MDFNNPNINNRQFVFMRLVTEGTSVSTNVMPTGNLSNSKVKIPGVFNGQNCVLGIDDDIMSKHMLVLGSTGCGKSNLFYHIIGQIKNRLRSDDVMIVFDTKGDYYDKFFNPNKDLVMGNSSQYRQSSVKWNIFKEILADGNNFDTYNQNCIEISKTIFSEDIEKNSAQSFFPNAACDVFASLLGAIVKRGTGHLEFKKDYYNNRALRAIFDEMDWQNLLNLLNSDLCYASSRFYIGDDPGNPQGLGVIASLQSVVRSILQGIFADDGRFSIREFVRNRGGRTIFIEYDLSKGSIFSPIYALIIDLALKEALGRNTKSGNVYVFCDEFRLLPKIPHMEDAVNFGRSLGVKVFAGLQTITQLSANYGNNGGKNIAAGFSTVFSFKSNDYESRRYTTDLYGKNRVLVQTKKMTGSISEESIEANVVEDWDLEDLGIGEAIVGLPFVPPFRFQIDLYR